MRKSLISLVSLGALVAILSGCGTYTPSGNAIEEAQQAANDKQQNVNQPLPSFPYSQMKQNLIEIETVEAQGIQSTSFIMGSMGNPDPIQICPSVGIPIPNTASLSNPHQIDGKWIGSDSGGHWEGGIVDQKDPNGIYVPASSAGTFVICIGADGNAVPTYAEGLVHTVMAPAVWDYTHHAVKITGPASFHFSKGRGQ